MGLLDLTPQFKHDFTLRKNMWILIIFVALGNNAIIECLQLNVILLLVEKRIFSSIFCNILQIKHGKVEFAYQF